MFVDDEEDLINIIKITFNRLEIDCLVAYNGEEALSILKENTDIDIICTDINMPIMDGYTLLGTLNANEEYLHIKKFIMSGNSTAEHENMLKVLSIPKNNEIPKPFNFFNFIDKVIIDLNK